MRINAEKKITKIIIFFIVVEFILSSPASLWAEENLPGNGYRDYLDTKIKEGYSLDRFLGLDRGQKERIVKRKQIEELVDNSRWANADLDTRIENDNQEKFQTSQMLQEEMLKQRQEREKVASTAGEFQYITYADGKKEFFTDGLVTSIENEKVTDEFGNPSRKDTRRMKYNDRRLLFSYETILTDPFGRTTRTIFDEVEYASDSVFYADHTTRANKNLTKYHIRQIDTGGNVVDRDWQAEKIEGKFVTAFTEKVIDSLYGDYSFRRTNIKYENNDPDRTSSYYEEGIDPRGLSYTSERNHITYDAREQMASYYETRTDQWGKESSAEAKFKYLEDRFSESIITTITKEADGAQKLELATTTYNYNADNQLVSAEGNTQFTGNEAKWGESADTLKDGTYLSGESEIEFEILQGKPMSKSTHSTIRYYNPVTLELIRTEKTQFTYSNTLINNLFPHLDTSREYTETTYPESDPYGNPQKTIRDIITTYSYDDNGNLKGVQSQGKGEGYELTEHGWMEYKSEINAAYKIILGEAKQERFEEKKYYKEKR